MSNFLMKNEMSEESTSDEFVVEDITAKDIVECGDKMKDSINETIDQRVHTYVEALNNIDKFIQILEDLYTEALQVQEALKEKKHHIYIGLNKALALLNSK
ncbi:hypothetical protein GJ496_005139 [Pomphorhynchus laevis]|nr:hypothetical protein GJ496_005139 [Pomphorhynchus laevis]